MQKYRFYKYDQLQKSNFWKPLDFWNQNSLRSVPSYFKSFKRKWWSFSNFYLLFWQHFQIAIFKVKLANIGILCTQISIHLPCTHIQLAQLILGRFALYAMIWGYFDLLKMILKVVLLPWTSGFKYIWSTVCSCTSNGCKVTSLQSLQSKKCRDILGSRLHLSQVYIVNWCSSGGPGSIPGHCKLWEPTIL